jgi:hypothetical protein
MPIRSTAAAVAIITIRQFSGLFDADASPGRPWPFSNILPLNAQDSKKPPICLFWKCRWAHEIHEIGETEGRRGKPGRGAGLLRLS